MITAIGEESPHISRTLDALDAQNIPAIQTGATVWEAMCPSCLDGRLEILDVDWGENGDRRVRLCCNRCKDEDAIVEKLGLRDRDLLLGTAAANGNGTALFEAPTIVTLEEFVAVDEPGAAPLLGDDQGSLIAEGSDVMAYGDGGAGKTTLLFDLALHLASGQDWLGIPIARPTNVLLIENEGPRPLLRTKLRRKLEAWKGPQLDGRASVFERPWGKLTLAEPAWREQLAATVRGREIDVIIAGPLTRLGMDTPGTLQEVVAFMRDIADVRERCGRLLTVVLVHHENRAGTVSGAWEGAADTLLHVQAAGNGHTIVVIQKARWDSARHQTTLKLAWADGEGFELEGNRDYFMQICELLSDGRWRTVKDIAAREDKGGIGAGEDAVKAAIDEHPDRFESRTGDDAKALGRHPSATVWQVRSGSNAPNAPCASQGGAEVVAAAASTPKGTQPPERTPAPPIGAAPDPQRTLLDADAERERLAAKWGDDLPGGNGAGSS